MTVRFVDTNVLLYAVSTDPEESGKAATAREILKAEDLALSVQVLQEFYVQATRPTRAEPLTHEQAADLVEAFARFPVQDLTLAVVRAALRFRERYGLAYWDSAIIEAARALGCRTVLSEDLSHGQDYGGVTVVNPFV
ncbi:MAG: PIN domain-containing protein [Bifidobacteriaceae bacterium]|jgi:predicted nucleic acid-binding protein|nr:PIN domain-containing protein [Bifidobacteriaceae bacterium]